MSMSTAYLNAVRTSGKSLITYIGLMESDGTTEVSSGSYARQAASWDISEDGTAKLSEDLEFDMSAGDTVGAWHGFSADTGGTDYGGATLRDSGGDPFSFSNSGTFTLLASGTSIVTSSE